MTVAECSLEQACGVRARPGLRAGSEACGIRIEERTSQSGCPHVRCPIPSPHSAFPIPQPISPTNNIIGAHQTLALFPLWLTWNNPAPDDEDDPKSDSLRNWWRNGIGDWKSDIGPHGSAAWRCGASQHRRQVRFDRMLSHYFIRFSNQAGPPHLPVTTMSRSPSASRSTTRRFRPEPTPWS